ncbi:hypothetical protein ABIB00_007726 [Bradyrhizobium sp. LB14.3]
MPEPTITSASPTWDSSDAVSLALKMRKPGKRSRARRATSEPWTKTVTALLSKDVEGVITNSSLLLE